MTAPFPSLVRFYSLTAYAPSKRRARNAPGAKPDAKRIAKTVGIAALAIFVVADIGGIYGYMNWATYAALKSAGMQDLMLLNATITAALLVFFLSFLTALTTYYASKADTNMLALPIKGRDLLGAKMAMVYLADFALAFLLVAVAALIYSIREAPPIGFYFGALLTALTVPLVPLAIIYLIVVPLMIAARPLRNKNAVMIVGGIIGMAFALAFNFYIQSVTSRMEDSSWVLANFAGPDATLARIGQAYPPAFLAWKSMTALSLLGPLCALANLALGLGATSLVALALGNAYAKSLLGFDEQRIKRVKATRSFMARSFMRRPALLSLFLREWRLMNREPAYFMNGPFVIVLMPLILIVGVLVMGQNHNAMHDLGPFLSSWKSEPWAMLASAAFGAFLGSSTSITSTALSRDAKALRYLKALPLNYRDFMLAKFLHGFAFAIFGALVGGAGCAIILGLGPLDVLAAFLIALAFSAFACIAGLWLDTANPRLGWDSPTSALKQNPNATIFILGVMGLIAALGVASAFIPWGKLAFFALYFGIFAAAAIALLCAYPRYAQSVIERIEI